MPFAPPSCPTLLLPWRTTLMVACAAWLAGCSPLQAPAPVAPQTPAAAPSAPTSPDTPGQARPQAAPSRPSSSERPAPAPSGAATPRAYRKDAASHLYALNAERIYKGMLQPNLYAIGVLQVDVDRAGRVTSLRWMRAPHHAPEVVKEIERTVRDAAPFPQPVRLGRVTYTDTWLWDKSGKFQLDTLTEGQL